jgi:hypothetical protein
MSECLPDRLAPAPLLLRFAEELRQCREILARVEHTFHQVLDGEIRADQPRMWQVSIQSIDLLEQNLGDLAACITAIANEPNLLDCPNVSEARVLGPLKLDDLRQRLHGKPGQQNNSVRIELF